MGFIAKYLLVFCEPAFAELCSVCLSRYVERGSDLCGAGLGDNFFGLACGDPLRFFRLPCIIARLFSITVIFLGIVSGERFLSFRDAGCRAVRFFGNDSYGAWPICTDNSLVFVLRLWAFRVIRC